MNGSTKKIIICIATTAAILILASVCACSRVKVPEKPVSESTALYIPTSDYKITTEPSGESTKEIPGTTQATETDVKTEITDAPGTEPPVLTEPKPGTTSPRITTEPPRTVTTPKITTPKPATSSLKPSTSAPPPDTTPKTTTAPPPATTQPPDTTAPVITTEPSVTQPTVTEPEIPVTTQEPEITTTVSVSVAESGDLPIIDWGDLD